ncbi:MAG: magnesium and cobalt transport protein CorA, partial [Bacteroidetes bacterium]|nr:magnesium and cobalt transport protein CorA [Bacteroidota bacterium]
ENDILTNPRKQHLLEIQSLKREVMFLRKSILAERDKLAELDRHDFALIDDKTRVYLRDTYDHTAQIVDIIESQKEISYSLMEVYLSTQNNKMSEVMKVLTVISSIFIPLTFIVGVYGMNFSSTDKDGKQLPLNMPELTSPYGYMGVWAIMFLIAIVQIIYFKRKNWL